MPSLSPTFTGMIAEAFDDAFPTLSTVAVYPRDGKPSDATASESAAAKMPRTIFSIIGLLLRGELIAHDETAVDVDRLAGHVVGIAAGENANDATARPSDADGKRHFVQVAILAVPFITDHLLSPSVWTR